MTDKQREALRILKLENDSATPDIDFMLRVGMYSILGLLKHLAMLEVDEPQDIRMMTKSALDSIGTMYDRAKYAMNLPSMPYDEYLQTPEWKRLAQTVKSIRGGCEVCGATERLEAHHKTYERRGHEDIDDLVVLCHKHHGEMHGFTIDAKDLPY
jgi:hypothetical protein